MAGGDGGRAGALSAEALAFAPGLLAIQERPPAPLPRAVLYAIVVLVALLLAWAFFGRLDVIASADGRLVPRTYLKIVQPADAGIVKEILVHEGQTVSAGQVLLRMDPQDAQADTNVLATALELKSLQLRRIDAELAGRPLKRSPSDPQELFERVNAQFEDHRRADGDAVGQARQGLRQAQEDLQAGLDTLEKLRKTNPLLKAQADSYAALGEEGYAAQVVVDEKKRAYVENDQDLRAQESKVASLEAAVEVANEQLREVTSKYRSDLQNEHVDAQGEYAKLQQEMIKQTHKAELLELRAPQAGVVKDLATHTVGTVVSAGTVLLSLVPENEPMMAEVTVRNEDVGFVHPEDAVELKLAAYPFQKYGMLHGEVVRLSPDASDTDSDDPRASDRQQIGRNGESNFSGPAHGYRALIRLDHQTIQRGHLRLGLLAGMQVIAEIKEGRRSILEYLLSPVQKTIQESGHER
jgi:hemolysin D